MPVLIVERINGIWDLGVGYGGYRQATRGGGEGDGEGGHSSCHGVDGDGDGYENAHLECDPGDGCGHGIAFGWHEVVAWAGGMSQTNLGEAVLCLS